MYSLRHLAAQKLPRDTRSSQPIRFVCKNIYVEAKKEVKKLHEERDIKRLVVDELYDEYNDALNPNHHGFLDQYADQFENICMDIHDQYDELETSQPALDHDEWYAYMEFIASRVAYSCRGMPHKPLHVYMVAVGIKTMTDAMKPPEGEPCAALAPVIQTIRRVIDLNNKFIEDYDAKYSFEVVEKKQKKYGKALHDWQSTIKPEINRKIEFYESVNAAVRPICSFIPNVCKKI